MYRIVFPYHPPLCILIEHHWFRCHDSYETPYNNFYAICWFDRMCMRPSMSSWGGSRRRTTLRLSWKPYVTWWTRSVWYQTGYTTSFWATDSQMLPTTQSKGPVVSSWVLYQFFVNIIHVIITLIFDVCLEVAGS